jgi:hypothetical protein
MPFKSNANNYDKYWSNTVVINPQEHNHLHHTLTTIPDKYESLPNFVGGLFVENGMLKLLNSDSQTIELGKVSDMKLNENIFFKILDKFFE